MLTNFPGKRPIPSGLMLMQNNLAIDAKPVECCLLGALLLDEKLLDEIPDNFSAEHFSIPVYGRIYSAMVALHDKGKAVDPFTISAELNSDEEFQAVGGPKFCMDLLNATIGLNIKEYINIIIDFFLRREVKKISIEMNYEAENKFGETEAIDIIDKSEQKLCDLSIKYTRESPTFVSEIINVEINDLQMNPDCIGITSGFTLLDKQLRGFNKPDLIILAGRPSMGKTALALNIAFNAAKTKLYNKNDGAGVIFFSLEMSAKQLSTRLVSIATNTSSREPKDIQIKVRKEFLSDMKDLPLYIYDAQNLTVRKSQRIVKKMQAKHSIGLVIIDYLQLISSDTEDKNNNRVQEISKITQQLKDMAKNLDVPVIVLSQLSRAVEQREDKRPQLADLRDSGSIEQDADIVMFIYREAYYKSRQEPKINTTMHDKWRKEMNEIKNKAEVIIVKYRNGPIGTVPLFFNPNLTKFTNIS